MSQRLFVFSLLAGTLLSGCGSAPSETSAGATASARERVKDPQIRVISEAEIIAGNRVRPLSTPDLLYEALQDLDADRLLTPPDDNAHGKFKQVLARQPNNEIALEGIQSIVLRYLQLSEESMRRGLFEEAELMLERARLVDPSHVDIERVETALAAEMTSGDLFFMLDGGEVAARSEDAQQQLIDIAKQARQAEAFFLITAPSDELGRWMFGIMREAVAGYRLRGNIELASRTSIRLRMPADAE